MEATREILKSKITENWKQYFIKYTGVIDIAKAAKENNVGHWTLNSIRTGARNIATDENKKSVQALAKVAIENAEQKKQSIEKDIENMKKDFLTIFDCI